MVELEEKVVEFCEKVEDFRPKVLHFLHLPTQAPPRGGPQCAGGCGGGGQRAVVLQFTGPCGLQSPTLGVSELCDFLDRHTAQGEKVAQRG